MPRIHYHTDCDSFAGCENMLVNFWASTPLRAEFKVSFSYRATPLYEQGLARRTKIDFPAYAMRFFAPNDPANLPAAPAAMRRAVSLALRLFPVLPLALQQIRALRSLFNKLRPDIVHINNGNYPGALSARSAAIAARLAGVPAVVMVVNNIAGSYDRPRRWLDYPLDRLVARSVSRFVTGSRAAASQLERVLSLAPGVCVPVHNGIASRPVSEALEETRQRLGIAGFQGMLLGVVAVLRPNKGHRVLLEALLRLRAASPQVFSQVRLLIEGEGPLALELRRFVADNGLVRECAFVGVEDNVMNFIAAMDVIALPSIAFEDFPNVVLEAMGLGKPVIASRIAGTPEQVVDGETGLLVDAGDAEGLAAAIARLAVDPVLRQRMGAAASARFREKFTAEASVTRYVALYRELLVKARA